MTSISYDEIFSAFLSKITDYSFMNLDESTVHDAMNRYLRNTIAQPFIQRAFSSFSLNDDTYTIEFELTNSINDLNDNSFVLDVLSKGMVIEWMKPKVDNTEHLLQFFGGTEAKFYSQSNHIDAVSSVLNSLKKELRKTVTEREYFYGIGD